MSKTEILKEYAQQKTEQHVSLLIDAPEMIRQIQQMRQELSRLPEAMANQIAENLGPMEEMAQALDQGLDTQRAIMEPLIQAAVDAIQKEMQMLSQDKVKRTVKMAQEQHRKNKQIHKNLQDWMQEAKNSRTQKAEMREQISQWKRRFWIATSVATTLTVVLILVFL